MPAGYSARCKVCNSRRRAEIERWVREEGLSVREVSRRLADEGEMISYESIRHHMAEHFDVRAEAREQYEKSKAQLQEAAQKQVSDLEMLDRIAQDSFKLYQGARAWLQELIDMKERLPATLVDLLTTTAGEVRQQLKVKAELLGDDPESKKAEAMESLVDLLRLADEAGETDDGGN